MRKNLFYFSFLLLIVISLTGCGEKKLEKISLSVDKLISINETKKISVEYEPENVEEEITWSSGNEEIASVSNGTITAKSVGNVTITATTTSGIKDQVDIEVYQKVDSITLDKENIELSVGSTSQIIATISPDEATYKDITWTSSDNSVASVENGLIIARSIGSSTITATTRDGTISKCFVKVVGSKEYAYFNEKLRWGMSIEEVQDNPGKGNPLNREPDVYVRYSPKSDDYLKSPIDEYVYWFRNSQLRAYWLDYEDSACTYNNYLDIRNTLAEKYGNPSSENYNWKDETYKNDRDKWADAFRYDDFTIKTTWNKSDFNIVVSWDHSSKSCSASYSQKEWTSKLF